LIPLYSDSNDLNPLKTSHFLKRDLLTILYSKQVNSWCRWRKEYPNQLMIGKKWHQHGATSLKESMMVITGDDNTTMPV
jgi:hypothetical protein